MVHHVTLYKLMPQLWVGAPIFKEPELGGQWTDEEAKAHINCLEIKAAFLALQSFSTILSETHVQIELDNTTAVSYINCMGGSRSKECNNLARQIVLWCIRYGFQLPIFQAQKMLKLTKFCVVFMTTQSGHSILLCFSYYVKKYLCQELIYLHAGQVQSYVAWRSNPKAVAIDAFTIGWTSWLFYAFPPYSYKWWESIKQKIREDSVEGILEVAL